MICQTEIELQGKKYLVYLKKVATRVKPGGEPENTCVKAFIRQFKQVP